ncbi:DUF3047 domain-containing protein [Aliidiomarina sp. Khilg15.8]
MKRFNLCLASLACVIFSAQANLDWKASDIIDWEPHSFEGNTDYQVNSEGTQIIAQCRDGQASGLFYRGEIDLNETPMISWEWRVNEFPDVESEQTKAGDDFAARIYVVKEHSILKWRTRALNYVWAQHSEAGSDWSNPFADQAHMVAQRHGEPGDNEWRRETRNMREDFTTFHGEAPDTINAIAIMTDCDNSNSRATAEYRSIRVHAAEAE